GSARQPSVARDGNAVTVPRLPVDTTNGSCAGQPSGPGAYGWTAQVQNLSLALRYASFRMRLAFTHGFGVVGSPYTALLRTEHALEHNYHQLRRRNRHDPAAARASEKRSGAAGDSARPAEVSQSRARAGQQSFAHAVRGLDRHDRQHGRFHADREDRR